MPARRIRADWGLTTEAGADHALRRRHAVPELFGAPLEVGDAARLRVRPGAGEALAAARFRRRQLPPCRRPSLRRRPRHGDVAEPLSARWQPQAAGPRRAGAGGSLTPTGGENRPGPGAEFAVGPGRSCCAGATRHRPARARRPCRHRTEPGRLSCSPAANCRRWPLGSTRWRAAGGRARDARSHQQDKLLRRSARLSGTTAAPKCWAEGGRTAGAGGAAVGPPRRHRALAAKRSLSSPRGAALN